MLLEFTFGNFFFQIGGFFKFPFEGKSGWKLPFNDHRSQLIGSRFFCYNSPAAAAREVFKPSTDAESLLGSI